MTKLLFLAPILFVLAVLLALGGRPATPVYACTLLYPAIEDAVPQSQAVAVVKAVSVGGPNNTAPTQVPDPGLFRDPNGRGTPIISLEGIGATLAVEEVLSGNMPSQVEVDEETRQARERAIRTLEANPGYMAPCSLEMGLMRWTASARYVVLLDRAEDGRWSAGLRYLISGSDVIVGHGGDGHPALIVGDAIYQAHFAGISAHPYFDTRPPWAIDPQAVPLQSLLAAIRDIQGARLTPPGTGDAGLR